MCSEGGALTSEQGPEPRRSHGPSRGKGPRLTARTKQGSRPTTTGILPTTRRNRKRILPQSLRKAARRYSEFCPVSPMSHFSPSQLREKKFVSQPLTWR